MVDYTIFSQNTQRKKSVGEGGSYSHSDVFEQRFVTPIKNVMQYNPPLLLGVGTGRGEREGAHTQANNPQFRPRISLEETLRLFVLSREIRLHFKDRIEGLIKITSKGKMFLLQPNLERNGCMYS